VVQLGSSPWVNGFIAAVFLVFGLSLLGAFEITLPSGLLTKMDQASQRGGSLGTLLMGLTFSLTSFACVGPFIGTLLASSVQRGGIQPALGMMAFASGLASPFFLLALFPAFLQKMPRSGGWLARVKVVLGFVVLAFAIYKLSAIDQVLQANILTRERFLAAWFVLFALAGLYLLGILRMEGIRHDETVGVGRMLAGAAFLIFAISLIPGMFGAPLGELDSYVPLARETSAPGGSPQRAGLTWMKNDLEGALAWAKSENKRVLVAFTGYACTNCHWMKANMFTRPEVAEVMSNFILVELYTDGTDPASEANQTLQESKFQTVAIPYYAIFDADQRVVATFAGLTRNSSDYLSFLKTT
jgi:thiol:disulfide interchange protein